MAAQNFWLAMTALLAASMWIPYIVGVNMRADKSFTDMTRIPDKRTLPDWVQRADRAHLNLIEQFVPFAALILLANQMGISNGWIAGAALAFLVIRLTHALGMITGLARFPVRPMIFTGGWVCVLIVGWQVLSA